MEVPREVYHTDWVADRTLSWLDGVGDEAPWFCWMSFPDPHHPWDVQASELHRVNWRDVPLPALYEETDAKRRALLASKPKHWLGYYENSIWTNMESPRDFRPADLSPDQIREINALTHIENELIDEACGRVLEWLQANGRLANTDVFFTTDHGELQGDFGLMFKGPYHVDALMRLPFLWAPAGWVEGCCLPRDDSEAVAQGRETVLTVRESEHGAVDVQLASIYRRDGWLCTAYEPGSLYEGTEGELYNMVEGPGQRVNLWSSEIRLREQLVEQLHAELRPPRSPRLPRNAPA